LKRTAEVKPAAATEAGAETSPPSDVHAEDIDELLDRLGASSSDGLNEEEAEKRLADYGPNALPPPPRKPEWLRFLEQFKDPLVMTLLVAAVIATVVGLSERSGAAGYPDTATPSRSCSS